MYTRWMVLMTMAVLLVVGMSVPAQGQDENSVWDEIALAVTLTDRPAENLPVGDRKCDYPANLNLTLKLLGNQTHQTWLTSPADIETIVNEWMNNLAAHEKEVSFDVATRNGHFQRLKEECDRADLKILKQPFRVLLDRRHKDSALGNAVRAAIEGESGTDDDLVFPLLSMGEGQANAVATYLIGSQFLESYGSKDAGGFGNLTYDQLYNTPATTADFSNYQVRMLLAAHRLGLLTETDCIEQDPAPAQTTPAGGVEESRAGIKCCVISTRQCKEPSTGYCNMCGSYCCLGGVTWCY